MALNVSGVKVGLGRGRVKVLVASHLIDPGLILEHCGCDMWLTVVLGYSLLWDHEFSAAISFTAPCEFIDCAADGKWTC